MKPARASLMLAGRYVLALICVLITVTVVDVASVSDALGRAKPGWVLGALVAGFAIWLVNTWKWQRLLRVRTRPPSLLTLFRLNMVSAFYGTVLPGQVAGEAVKAFRVASGNRDRAVYVASIAVDRITGLIGLLVVGLVGAVATGAAASVTTLLGLATFAAIVATLWLIRQRPVVTRPEPRPGRIHRLRHMVLQLATAIGEYRRHRAALGVAGLLSMAFQLGLTTLVWMFARALDLEVTILEMAWVVAVVSLVQLLPITVASIGTREAAFIVLLGTLDVARPDALALSFLLLMSNLALAAVGLISELVPGSWNGGTSASPAQEL